MIVWTDALRDWQWIGMLLARVSVGLSFALSGGQKLFVSSHREQMLATIREAGLPAAALTAVAVSLVEFICGGLLVIGLLTPLSCVMLSGVMLGALSTTVLPRIKAETLIDWLGAVLYLPEVLYVIILVWLFLSGPGWISVDHLIRSSAE
jgi:putative oxidoreductase